MLSVWRMTARWRRCVCTPRCSDCWIVSLQHGVRWTYDDVSHFLGLRPRVLVFLSFSANVLLMLLSARMLTSMILASRRCLPTAMMSDSLAMVVRSVCSASNTTDPRWRHRVMYPCCILCIIANCYWFGQFTIQWATKRLPWRGHWTNIQVDKSPILSCSSRGIICICHCLLETVTKKVIFGQNCYLLAKCVIFNVADIRLSRGH